MKLLPESREFCYLLLKGANNAGNDLARQIAANITTRANLDFLDSMFDRAHQAHLLYMRLFAVMSGKEWIDNGENRSFPIN